MIRNHVQNRRRVQTRKNLFIPRITSYKDK